MCRILNMKYLLLFCAGRCSGKNQNICLKFKIRCVQINELPRTQIIYGKKYPSQFYYIFHLVRHSMARANLNKYQLMQILGLLGIYFDAVVVFVTNFLLLIRLALAILWWVPMTTKRNIHENTFKFLQIFFHKSVLWNRTEILAFYSTISLTKIKLFKTNLPQCACNQISVT